MVTYAEVDTEAVIPVGHALMLTLDGTGKPQAVASGTPVPTSPTPPSPTTVLNTPAGTSQSANGNSGSLATTGVAALAVDVNLQSFTGGTAPTAQFFVDRLGVDAVWYRVWTSAALATAGPASTNIGPGCTLPSVLSSAIRFGWILAGTVAPTSITYSASIVGR